jgi:hypothetical protein
MCQHQYFLTYILGLPRRSNKKADKGTIVHKVYECLAKTKLEIQNNPNAEYVSINDDAIGLVTDIKVSDFLKPYMLSNSEVEAINSTRLNKSVYVKDCKINYGHIRYGVELVEKFLNLCYDYYTSNSEHTWKPVDFKDCTNWAWMGLDGWGGKFDPRRKTVVMPELSFDVEIKEEWAKYSINNQEKYLRLKGTIDLVTSLDENTLEIQDLKTGSRLDWATGEVKDFKKLCNDKQLMLYYYVAKKMFPDKNIILTIHFVRDGGPYSICFDEYDLPRIEKMLRENFEDIKQNKLPKLRDPSQKDFMCNRLCDFYKDKIGNENVCKAIHKELIQLGMSKVIETRTRKGFTVDYYEAPG